MSTTYRAYAAIGVLIPRSKLFRKVRVRCCQHLNFGGGAFCPQCGKPSWRDTEEPIPEFDPEAWPMSLCGFAVQRTQDEAFFLVAETILAVDFGCSREGVTGQSFTDDFSGARNTLRAALEPAGLWDANGFGLWCVMTAG